MKLANGLCHMTRKRRKRDGRGFEEQAAVVILIPWASFIDTHSIDFHNILTSAKCDFVESGVQTCNFRQLRVFPCDLVF